MPRYDEIAGNAKKKQKINTCVKPMMRIRLLGNLPKAAAVNGHVAIKIRRRCNSGLFRQYIESPNGTLNATMSKKGTIRNCAASLRPSSTCSLPIAMAVAILTILECSMTRQ